MNKSRVSIPMKLGDRFDKAFPGNRLPNGIIDKNKTRVGITYTVLHQDRHLICVLPGANIIDEAVAEYPYLNLQQVQEGIDVKDIMSYLSSGFEFKKIVTTPEGFWKVMEAADKLGVKEWLLNDFYLYLDEAHCYAVEAFRDDILIPFKWLWKFRNIAFGSATMFEFSNPKFQAMPRYELTYNKEFGHITIIDEADPGKALNHILTHPEMFPGKVYFFFNTVTGIGEAIMKAGLENDVYVFCRDEERNMNVLDEAKKFFHPDPKKIEYAKFNFFSVRYNEGWNLDDDNNPTIVIVSNVHVPHSAIGITFKGAQAAGRIKITERKKHKIYHLTNNLGKADMVDFCTIQKKHLYNAQSYVDAYNTHATNCASNKIEDDGKLKEMIKRIADFDQNDTATLNHEGVDQGIYAEYSKAQYNSIETIREAWHSCNYTTDVIRYNLAPLKRGNKSKKEHYRQIIKQYQDWKVNPHAYVYKVAEATIAKYKIDYALLFEAFEILGPTELDRLDYDEQSMREELITRSNDNAQAKLRLRLVDYFIVGNRYSKKEIKKKLQELYNELQIRDPKGEIKKATATDLENYGLFQLHDCKIPVTGSKPINGWEIKALKCRVSTAA